MLHAWNAICDESLVMEEFVRIRMENSEIKVTLMEITRFLEKTNSMSEVFVVICWAFSKECGIFVPEMK
jgi:hypothetical protein